MSTIVQDAAEQTRPNQLVESDPQYPSEDRDVSVSSLAGASPAVPRDPRLLLAEQADYEARKAAEEAESARIAAEDAVARAAATKAAAEQSRAELEAARAEAKAKAEAAALQVRLERQEFDQQAAAVRAQQRAARDQQLGTVRTVDEAEQPVATVTRRSTDAPLGALAFFLVRLAVGGWAGIVGWQALVDQQATVDALLKVGIPQEYTSWLGWGTGIGLLVIAFFVLVGLGTRIFAALMLAGVAGFLAFFRFGPFSPFLEGHFGFYGDRDVFLAVLCLLLVLLGAGGWSVDANMRRRRKAAAKPE